MFRQEKEFFRFHLRVIFVLVFAALLCQSEAHQKARVTEVKSCSDAASRSARMKKDNFEEVVEDREHFLFNLLDCTRETHKLIMKAPETEDCKTFDGMIPSEVLMSVMNKMIPEVISTTSFATKEQRLILLSVHLVNISHRIRRVSCLADFWTKGIITLDDKESLEIFHLELKQNVLDFCDSTLMAQWKSENITILENNTDTLINMLITFSTTLINLLEKIRSYIDETYLKSSRWPFRYFRSEHKNVAKLDEQKTETDTLRTELVMLKTDMRQLPALSETVQKIILITVLTIFLFWLVCKQPALVRQLFELLQTLTPTLHRTNQNLRFLFRRLTRRLIHRNP